MTADDQRQRAEHNPPDGAAAPWPPGHAAAGTAPHPPHDPAMTPPAWPPPHPGAPYAAAPYGPPPPKPRRPRPSGLWVALVVTWAIAQPIGPVGVAVAPDMIMGILYVGVFALPLIWAGSLVGTLAIGTVLHTGVRFFRHRWLVVLVAAVALTACGAGFLIGGAASPGWIDDILALSGRLLPAGSAAGLIVVFVAWALTDAQQRMRRRQEGARVQDRGDARTDSS